MSDRIVSVATRIGDCWFSALAQTPAEAYRMVSAIIDQQCDTHQKCDTQVIRDRNKSEFMRKILNIFDGDGIGHESSFIKIKRIMEETN